MADFAQELRDTAQHYLDMHMGRPGFKDALDVNETLALMADLLKAAKRIEELEKAIATLYSESIKGASM